MQVISNMLRRSIFLSAAIVFLLLTVLTALGVSQRADAATLSSRKIEISSSSTGSTTTGDKGEGANGAFAEHDFTFTPTATTIGAVLFRYCTTPFGTCTAPTGMDASTITSIAANSGYTGTYVLDTTTNIASGGNANIQTNAPGCTGTGNGRANCILITNSSNTAETAVAHVTEFGTGGGTNYIKNPTSTGTYFVRITTFTTDSFATIRDEGNVAFAIVETVTVTATVQEQLKFSVSNATNATGGSSTCNNLPAGAAITLGTGTPPVLSFATAYDDYTYFRVQTNSANGTKIYYSGETLESGSNNIDAWGAESVSAPGTEQFGLAFDDTDGAHSFTNLTMNASYDEGDGAINTTPVAKFAFSATADATPVEVATSTGAVLCDTGALRYVANITPNTAAGIYTTAVDYIATPTY